MIRCCTDPHVGAPLLSQLQAEAFSFVFCHLFFFHALCSWMWALTKPLLTHRDLPGHGCQVTQRPTWGWRGGGAEGWRAHSCQLSLETPQHMAGLSATGSGTHAIFHDNKTYSQRFAAAWTLQADFCSESCLLLILTLSLFCCFFLQKMQKTSEIIQK